MKVQKSWTPKKVKKEIEDMHKKGYKNVHLKRHGQLYIEAENKRL